MLALNLISAPEIPRTAAHRKAAAHAQREAKGASWLMIVRMASFLCRRRFVRSFRENGNRL